MIHDVVIVGSGPAGYTAAIYAARAGLDPLVLAGSVTAGGALMSTTEVENYPGFVEGIQGPELMGRMQEQAERLGAEIRYEDVTGLELVGEVKRVTTDDGVYEARTVIVATGSEYRRLGVEGEDRLSGHGVSYCATCDGFFFRDRPIVVVGGGDAAMEEALFLARFGSSVTVVHRRDALRASAAMARRALDDPRITFAWNSRVVGLGGRPWSRSPWRTRSPGSAARSRPPACSWPLARSPAPSSSGTPWSWTTPATSASRPPASAPTSPGSSPAATSPTPTTSRRSRQRDPGAGPPWTPSTTWPTTPEPYPTRTSGAV